MAREYQFRGKHADIVTQLTSEIDSQTKFKLFERNIDVYILAPIVGFIFGKQSKIDNTTTENIKKINFDQLDREEGVLNYNFSLIMLLHDKDKIGIEERLNRAFRYGSKDEERKELNDIYESYVLGGIEVLKEKLLENAINPDDYINNLYNFIDEHNTRYHEGIKEEDILDLCSVND
ncbi:MAG: hypothetical protein PHR25_02145 [Clostridia bacterium]|nr:hypothetical protein [Clostridia bacterium]